MTITITIISLLYLPNKWAISWAVIKPWTSASLLPPHVMAILLSGPLQITPPHATPSVVGPREHCFIKPRYKFGRLINIFKAVSTLLYVLFVGEFSTYQDVHLRFYLYYVGPHPSAYLQDSLESCHVCIPCLLPKYISKKLEILECRYNCFQILDHNWIAKSLPFYSNSKFLKALKIRKY